MIMPKRMGRSCKVRKNIDSTGCKPPAPDYAGGADEHARRIIELGMADNPIGRRAA